MTAVSRGEAMALSPPPLDKGAVSRGPLPLLGGVKSAINPRPGMQEERGLSAVVKGGYVTVRGGWAPPPLRSERDGGQRGRGRKARPGLGWWGRTFWGFALVSPGARPGHAGLLSLMLCLSSPRWPGSECISGLRDVHSLHTWGPPARGALAGRPGAPTPCLHGHRGIGCNR